MGKLIKKLLVAAVISCLAVQGSVQAGLGAWLSNFLHADFTTQYLEIKSHNSLKARHKYLNHLIDRLALHADLGNKKKVRIYDELIHQSNAQTLTYAEHKASALQEMILTYSNLEVELADIGKHQLAGTYARLTKQLHTAQLALATTPILLEQFAHLREKLAQESSSIKEVLSALQDQEETHRLYNAALKHIAYELISLSSTGLGDIGYILLSNPSMIHNDHAHLITQSRRADDPLSTYRALAAQRGITQCQPIVLDHAERLQQTATIEFCLQTLQKSLPELVIDAKMLTIEHTREITNNEGIPVFERNHKICPAAEIAADAQRIQLQGDAHDYSSEDGE